MPSSTPSPTVPRPSRQEPQLGTADAVRVGLTAVRADAATVLVTMGDAPLQPADLYRAILPSSAVGDAGHRAGLGPPGRMRPATAASCAAPMAAPPPIVEEADADAATRALGEINVGTYAFDGPWLRERSTASRPSASGEHT